jgi:hypothetical protein
MAKSKHVESTKEERLANDLQELRNYQRINEPTIFYKVGEHVQLGSIDKTTVLEVLDNGKILKVHVYSVNGKNQQNPGKISFDEHRYVAWHDLEPYRTITANKEIEEIFKEDEHNLNFLSSSIESLFDYYYRCNLDMEPDYQRGHIWTLEDKVALIDSIFNDIEIGKFVLILTGNSKNQYEILDGKQRLTALVEFYEGRFKYKSKTFYELNRRDQSMFLRFHISYARTEEPMPSEMKYRYFLRLNTRGKEQDPKHIEYVKSLLEKTHG